MAAMPDILDDSKLSESTGPVGVLTSSISSLLVPAMASLDGAMGGGWPRRSLLRSRKLGWTSQESQK